MISKEAFKQHFDERFMDMTRRLENIPGLRDYYFFMFQSPDGKYHESLLRDTKTAEQSMEGYVKEHLGALDTVIYQGRFLNEQNDNKPCFWKNGRKIDYMSKQEVIGELEISMRLPSSFKRKNIKIGYE